MRSGGIWKRQMTQKVEALRFAAAAFINYCSIVSCRQLLPKSCSDSYAHKMRHKTRIKHRSHGSRPNPILEASLRHVKRGLAWRWLPLSASISSPPLDPHNAIWYVQYPILFYCGDPLDSMQ
jgi:hypothetical protein